MRYWLPMKLKSQSEFPCICDGVFGAGLEAMRRNAGDVVARCDEDIAVRVRNWIKRRGYCQCGSVCGINVAVIRIRIPTIPFIIDFCSTPCRMVSPALWKYPNPWMAEVANIDDVIGQKRSEDAEAPSQLSLVVGTLEFAP